MRQIEFSAEFKARMEPGFSEARVLISDKNEFAEGFLRFAMALERLEEADAELAKRAEMQAELRKAIKLLWDAFTGEVTRRTKMGALMSAHKPTEDDIQDAMAASEARGRIGFRRYLDQRPLADRTAWNASKKGSDTRRRIITAYLDSLTQPISEAYEGHANQIAYVGALYNTTLPTMIKVTRGYVQQLFPPHPPWRIAVGLAAPEPKRVPVTSLSIRTEIADFLTRAEAWALELAALERKRDAVRETRDL